MDVSESSNVLCWHIRLHKPEQFDNPDWHGIQSVLVREFGEAIWRKISGTVFDRMEMALIPYTKQPLTDELLTQVSAVAKSLAPEAKSSIYPEFWKLFTEHYWPGIRTRLEERIKSGKAGFVISMVPNKLAFTMIFVAPVYLLPPEWEAPNIRFVMKDIVIRGIIPIVVSLEPQLGSPMN